MCVTERFVCQWCRETVSMGAIRRCPPQRQAIAQGRVSWSQRCQFYDADEDIVYLQYKCAQCLSDDAYRKALRDAEAARKRR